jgi:hypothetical protein
MLDRKQVQYNQAVMKTLRAIDEGMANTLNVEGTALGWWDAIRYWQTQGLTAQDAADKLFENEHTHQWGPWEASHLGGNFHRKCQVDGCKAISLDNDEDDES